MHIPGKIFVYLILMSTLPVLKDKSAWKFVRETLMEKKLHTELKTNILAGSQATIKPVASLLQVQKYFSRNWSYILPLSLLVNGPFLVSGFA